MSNKEKQKETHSKYVGLGLILGVAIGYSVNLNPINAAIGAGLGIVFGAAIGNYKLKN